MRSSSRVVLLLCLHQDWRVHRDQQDAARADGSVERLTHRSRRGEQFPRTIGETEAHLRRPLPLGAEPEYVLPELNTALDAPIAPHAPSEGAKILPVLIQSRPGGVVTRRQLQRRGTDDLVELVIK